MQLLTHLVVDMQLLPGVHVLSLPGMNVSSFTGVDVKYQACVMSVYVQDRALVNLRDSPPTDVCARQPTYRCLYNITHLCTLKEKRNATT